ncbi:MAG: hypothetical protein NC927_01370, partial [Candidatus Omnitrophica bacterium]|nr:hypothetical protein [Candidatus Omnitrophota bacterium]
MGRVFLYLGEEDFLKREALIKLRDSYGEKTAYFSFCPEDDGFSMEEVILLARTNNLFSPHQIIVIKDIDKVSSSDKEVLLSYIKNPTHYTDLVLLTRLKMKKLDNEDNLWIKKLCNEPGVKFREFSSLSEYELRNWIVAEVDKCGKKISPPALALLF